MRNVRERRGRPSGRFRRKKDESERISELMSARSSDGERPANQTKKRMQTRLIKSANRLVESFLARKNAAPPKSERCMPDNAIMWLSPAFLNASETDISVYSLAPEKSASKNPPEAPHANISFLNKSLERARFSKMRETKPFLRRSFIFADVTVMESTFFMRPKT